MAFDPTFKMSFRDASGNYYQATQDQFGVWTVTTSTSQQYIKVLPEGWDKTAIRWERDLSYLGVFRSKSDESFLWVKDARAIISYIWNTQGIRGFCTFTIYMLDFPSTGIVYNIFYQSCLDFKTYSDNIQTQKLSIGSLDSGLFRDFRAYSDTAFNVPIWQYDSGLATWLTDAQCLLHDGIKVLYQASYISGAKPTSILVPPPGSLYGFNHGSLTDGRHWLPSMNQYNIVQANGATTFFGNDVVQAYLIQRDQQLYYEDTFNGPNDSRPYSRDQYLIKNLCNPGSTIDMTVNLKGTFNGNIDYSNFTIYHDQFVGFVLFEIGSDDLPTFFGGLKYIPILYYPLPDSGSPYTPPSTGDFSASVDVALVYNKVYVLGVIYDDHATGISGHICTFGLSDLEITFTSRSDSGTSGVPVPAPSFPPSAFYGFRPYQLLEKLVPYLATRQTDGYGFPTPVATAYNGHSDYLQDSTLAAVQDVVPYQIIMSSAYCLHNLEGQSYLTLSLNNVFDFCKKILGCGLSIEGDTIRIENLGYFFDTSTMILDLGDNVAELEIEQMTEGIGANLKLGYTQQNTNADFGVETVHTELFFNTPVAEIPGTMDYQETGIIVDPYAAEKIRVQRVAQPVGTAYNPGSPSGSDNQTLAFYTLPNVTQIIPNVDYPITMYDPSNVAIPGQGAFQLTQRNGVNLPAAQSTDPTAASAPYIFGLRYPDSMYNIELSPCRSLQRPTGALLHSVLHMMDSESLTFRNTYIMQYNNQVLALSGIESNLEVGASAPVITEFKDIQIGTLPDKLFLPVKLKIKTKTPVNTYLIVNTNPRGYVQFKNYLPTGGFKIYKGFIARIEQNAGNRSPTEMELWATPDMTF